jgi:hypothetical protein
MLELASVERAAKATDAEHAAARDTERCPIYPGRVHTRRLRLYLARGAA